MPQIVACWCSQWACSLWAWSRPRQFAREGRKQVSEGVEKRRQSYIPGNVRLGVTPKTVHLAASDAPAEASCVRSGDAVVTNASS